MAKLILGYNGIIHNYLAQQADDTGEDLGAGEEAEVEEDEADPEETEDGDEGEAEEAEDEEGSDEDSDQGLGNRAKKRIDKLLGRSKAAEAQVEKLQKELDTARKLGGDEGKTFVAAAEKAGILPGLMSREEAQAFSDLEDIPVLVKRYKKWMNTHDKGDELELPNGKTMDYSDVVDRVDELTDELEDLRGKYGERRKELQANVKELFELGLAAKKAGWSPAAKKSSEKKLKTKPSAGEGRHEATRSRTRVDEIEVTDGDSLEAYMAAMRRNKKKED